MHQVKSALIVFLLLTSSVEAQVAFVQLEEHIASLKQNPPIQSGTPVPYTPSGL